VVIGNIVFVLYRQLILQRDFVTCNKFNASTRNIRVAQITNRLSADSIDKFECPCIFVNNRKVSQHAIIAVVAKRNEGD